MWLPLRQRDPRNSATPKPSKTARRQSCPESEPATSRVVTSTRFANRLKNPVKGSELDIFEDCLHAALYENVAAFNTTTLAFLSSHSG